MKNATLFNSTAFYLLNIFAFIVFAVTSSKVHSEDSVPVTVERVKYEQRDQVIINSGRIRHKNEMQLSFKTSGLIESIHVEEGDHVNAHQVLATLDLEEINAQQQRAKSNFETAVADLIRFTKLYEESLVSLQIKQNAKSAHDNAEAELQIANFNKKLSVIRAPSSGRILKRFVESSELIQSGQPVFILASTKQGAVVRVGLVDQDIVKVTIGDPVDILIDAYPGKTFTGQISEIALSTSSNAGTFEVEISIKDQGLSLRSGLIARVEITPQAGQAQLFIPIESVFEVKNGIAKIFLLDAENNIANEVSVEIVEFLENEVNVRGSLSDSDQVIKLGAPYLNDGDIVTIVNGK